MKTIAILKWQEAEELARKLVVEDPLGYKYKMKIIKKPHFNRFETWTYAFYEREPGDKEW